MGWMGLTWLKAIGRNTTGSAHAQAVARHDHWITNSRIHWKLETIHHACQSIQKLHIDIRSDRGIPSHSQKETQTMSQVPAITSWHPPLLCCRDIEIEFNRVEAFVNDDMDTTFLSYLMSTGRDQVASVIASVDEVLLLHEKQPFYEVSGLWNLISDLSVLFLTGSSTPCVCGLDAKWSERITVTCFRWFCHRRCHTMATEGQVVSFLMTDWSFAADAVHCLSHWTERTLHMAIWRSRHLNMHSYIVSRFQSHLGACWYA